MTGALSRLIPGLPLQHLRALLCALALLTQLAVPLLHGQHSHCDHHHGHDHGGSPTLTAAAEAEHGHHCRLCEELARTHWTLATAAPAVSQPAFSAAVAPTLDSAFSAPRIFRDALAARGPPQPLA